MNRERRSRRKFTCTAGQGDDSPVSRQKKQVPPPFSQRPCPDAGRFRRRWFPGVSGHRSHGQLATHLPRRSKETPPVGASSVHWLLPAGGPGPKRSLFRADGVEMGPGAGRLQSMRRLRPCATPRATCMDTRDQAGPYSARDDAPQSPITAVAQPERRRRALRHGGRPLLDAEDGTDVAIGSAAPVGHARHAACTE